MGAKGTHGMPVLFIGHGDPVGCRCRAVPVGMGGGRRAAPTTGHYLPMLYAAALRQEDERLEYAHAGIRNESVSMRCFMISRKNILVFYRTKSYAYLKVPRPAWRVRHNAQQGIHAVERQIQRRGPTQMPAEEKRILIVDDDTLVSKVLSELVLSIGFKPVVAANGREAIGLFSKTPFPVVVTDISMPVMGGDELIDLLKGREDEPVILVMTGHDESSIIIDVMRKGVFDYILKPPRLDELALKLERAFETSSLRRIQHSIDRERVVRLEKELEWYKWNERVLNRDVTKIDKSLFHSLHMSFNQGAGFGALLTLLDMVAGNAVEENGRYLLDADIMRLIKENAAVAGKILKTFADIDWMLSHDLTLEAMTCDGFYDLIGASMKEMDVYLAIKSQSLLLSDRKPAIAERKVRIDREYMRKVLAELIINACKFSESAYPIYILLEAIDKNLVLSVVSRPVPDEQKRTGIPLGYENIVFEPFYRMTKVVFEGYSSLDYGLGLTLVDKIMTKHGGKASITNILDYSDLKHEPLTKVVASLAIPLE